MASERCTEAEPACFDCGDVEQQRRVFSCRHDGRKEHQEDASQMFQTMLQKQETASELSNTMMACLKQWEQCPDAITRQQDVMAKVDGNLQPFGRNDEFSEHVFQAMQNQNDIGWDNFLKGRLGRHWCRAQEVHCHFQKKMDDTMGKRGDNN